MHSAIATLMFIASMVTVSSASATETFSSFQQQIHQTGSSYYSASSAPADNSPMGVAAKACGEDLEQKDGPAQCDGKTMCGKAVGDMVTCLAKKMGQSTGGSCSCGNGKDWVDCSNGAIKQCGYEKVSDWKDPRCSQPGAVLGYNSSPTARGAEFGHVEFVAGPKEYCSVYAQPMSAPWPNSKDSSYVPTCWVPTFGKSN